MKKMRKALSLILALVLAFSLAAVPAFAADTKAEEQHIRHGLWPAAQRSAQ